MAPLGWASAPSRRDGRKLRPETGVSEIATSPAGGFVTMSTFSQVAHPAPVYSVSGSGLLERVTVLGAVVVALMLYLSMHGYIPVLMTTDQTQTGADGTV